MSDLVGNPEDRFSCVAAHIWVKTIRRETMCQVNKTGASNNRIKRCNRINKGEFEGYRKERQQKRTTLRGNVHRLTASF